jgi:hypothetical protein
MSEKGNPLLDYFVANGGRSIHKWLHYFEIYHRCFERYRSRSGIKFLEIGVQNGGSTHMWREYFSKDARIIGMDIDPACREMEKDGFEIWIGDQASRDFWTNFKQKHSSLDIILDDGGHTMEQQLVAFQELFPILSDGGIYLCEDTHSSYLSSFQGGLRRQGTFIEAVKNMIDHLHSWYYQSDEEINNNYLTNYLYSIQVFDSIVVFEKRRKTQPLCIMTGNDQRVGLGFGLMTNASLRQFSAR